MESLSDNDTPNAIPGKVPARKCLLENLARFRQGKCLLENRPAFGNAPEFSPLRSPQSSPDFLTLDKREMKFWFFLEKKPIKKNHMKEFGGRNALEASRGYIRDVQGHPGHLGRYIYIYIWTFKKIKGQNVRKTDGTYDGTDGICPWDRWNTRCPAKILTLRAQRLKKFKIALRD